jgi:hypothetical protein
MCLSKQIEAGQGSLDLRMLQVVSKVDILFAPICSTCLIVTTLEFKFSVPLILVCHVD